MTRGAIAAGAGPVQRDRPQPWNTAPGWLSRVEEGLFSATTFR